MAITKLSEVDNVLIRYADTLSPEAISFKVESVLTPAQVRNRIAELLRSPDWLTSAQEDQLITLKMRQLVVGFEEMPLNARTGEILLRALEAVGTRLEKRQEATEKDLATLYAFQGKAMLEAIAIAVTHMRTELTGGVAESEQKWDAAKENAIRYAQIELSKHDA